MKKILGISLALLMIAPAWADSGDAARLRTYIDLSSMKMEQGKNLGAGGVGFEGHFAVTDKVTVGAKAYGSQSQKKDGMRITTVEGAVNTAYHIQAGERVTISPRIGAGYEQLTFKQNDDKAKHQRAYVEVGVGARIAMTDNWNFQPDIAYQKDVHTKVKYDSGSDDAKKGDKYTVELGFARSTGTGYGEFVVAPFYRHYNLKYTGGSSKINQYGVRVGYNF